MNRLLLGLACLVCASASLADRPPGYQFGDDELSQRIAAQDWQYVEAYLDQGGAADWRDRVGNSLLAYVVIDNANALARRLIDGGAFQQVSMPDEFEDLFDVALRASNLEIATILLEKFDARSLPAAQDAKSSLLRRAVVAQNYDFIALLLERGADINYLHGDESSLQLALQHEQNPDFFFYLLALGAELNLSPGQNGLLLYTASYQGMLHVLRYLLGRGLPVDSETPDGHTALTGAIQSGDNAERVIGYLLESGIDPCGGSAAALATRKKFLVDKRPDLLTRFPQLDCAE